MQVVRKNLAKLIFFSRWLQAPLYVGLMCALAAYVYHFIKELVDLFSHINGLSDTSLMLGVLGLIDVVMIANLLIMVIMGGYETFVASLNLDKHPDQPEWLDHLDAGAMKIKLALALIGISSIHLLRTFIEPSKLPNDAIGWQVAIHVTLLVSALTIAFTNRLLRETD
ncbi:MAG: TIGR00645 family protein [Legionella sp.]|nr:MAG: TIGR00645 family protein [Legionella sp.]